MGWHPPSAQTLFVQYTRRHIEHFIDMLGKIRQKLIASDSRTRDITPPVTCPICDRQIPESQKDLHHLIPKSKGGKTTEYLHRICHRQIHALFTESELAKTLNTSEALREQPAMRKFIEWVKHKPDDFYQKSAKSHRIKR